MPQTYLPPPMKLCDRALYAKSVGATALLVLPGLVGWDMVRLLRENDDLALPIIDSWGVFRHVFLQHSGRFFGSPVAFSIIPRFGGG